MKQWSYQQRDGVVCPKPQRPLLLLHFNESITPSSRLRHNHINQQGDAGDTKAGTELLDIIKTKGPYGCERSTLVASSPPFFNGSPPSRASNPVIQDEQFGNDNGNPFSRMLGAPSPSSRKNGGCVRVNFGPKPAPMRIEGFNCRGNCSISAVA